jgi:hypothetical protein
MDIAFYGELLEQEDAAASESEHYASTAITNESHPMERGSLICSLAIWEAPQFSTLTSQNQWYGRRSRVPTMSIPLVSEAKVQSLSD